MKKLLAVYQGWSWPLISGFTIRTTEIIRALSKDWKITLIAPKPNLMSAQKQRCSEDNLLIEDIGVDLRILAPSLLSEAYGFPMSEEEVLMKLSQEYINAEKPDVILCWSMTAKLPYYLRSLKKCPIIVDIIDCLTLTEARSASKEKGAVNTLRKYYGVVKRACQERAMVKASDLMLTAGKQDARVLKSLAPFSKVAHIGNGVQFQSYKTEQEMHHKPCIVFSGVLSFEPNLDALLFFAQEVFPLVRSKIRDATFIIAGRNPTPDVRKLVENTEGIELYENVRDMFKMLKEAWIAIAPMRLGSGVKNKILEAWSVGTPVVYSSLAENGLLPLEASMKLSADTPQAIAEKVVHLLSNRSLCSEVGRQCYDFVREHYSWEGCAQQISILMNDAIQRKRADIQ
jgi:glycosyltransferase involved in cell wall biosynthesis